jgi:hypothetical protein
LRHVEVQKLPTDGIGKNLPQIGFAGPGRACKQEYADRLAAVLKR